MASLYSASVRRRRDLKDEEEDASIGKLGQEFMGDQAQPLLISEVKFILEQIEGDKEDGQQEHDQSSNPIYKKTLDYIEIFSRYNALDTVRSLRADHLHPNTLKPEDYDENGNLVPDEASLQLTGFEGVQIADLAVENVEEAKTLIPTLVSKDDMRLAELLEEISNARRFQTTG
ncbi:hypothetical protein K437DRAFT_259242 [Tilletiaria anomala UBC 951]|uniref:RNA polymerase Rpb4/RPC9 core domain-containing protein n=1 Tax=Tilletiaria anomala (strain ATCC 24038 / CBS 436.72 / UBC 951) TaxID=1037660 RepID=A0A066VBW5_TILAU|nr:uncharacterized protein K437DRAFT_259242 [Tilletiaria anomala UBC 951]KDN38941.1 hypothetical protein K437DRAFT_259242 [Tilletiaria anomala UBC 951]